MHQLRLLLSYALMFLLGLFFTSHVQAQITTATLNGVVTNDKGESLPAAAVVAIHEPTQTQYGTTTRDDGRYTLPNLRVGGPYTITSTFLGHTSEQSANVYLSLAQKLTLNFELKESSVELDAAVVTAKTSDILNSERTGAATNISSDQLRKLPTISRSASDYTRLTPSASGNSFGGRNDQFNNFSLDGSIFNNPFGLDAATPGGQTDAQPISLDAIDQINVSIAPYDVTQAGFTGAAVNAVTKSGSNDWAGTVFGFYRNDKLTGSKVDGEDIFVPDLRQYQIGFSIGGPIIKDKLFFFANAELERREDLGSNFVAQTDANAGEPQTSRVFADDLQAVSNALATIGYETGPYEGYLHNSDNQKGIFKLDWNINDQHTLTATYNFLDALKDKPAHPSAIGRRGPDATTLQFFNSGYQIKNKIHSGIVELRSLFGNKFSNKVQVGYTAFRDSRDPNSAPIPVININKDGIRYIVAGHEPFSIHNVLDQDVFQFTDNFNMYMGAHTITVGTSLERFDFNNSFNLGSYDPFTYGGGTFGPGFASVEAFVDTVLTGGFDDELANAQAVFAANEANGTWALAETNVGQWAIYGQDEWAVNDDFTLTIGLRLDKPLYFNTATKIQENIDRNCCYDPSITYFDENGDPINFDHTVLPSTKFLINPRIGFNWDLNGAQKTQIRGGTGLFSGRLPFVWIGNQVANPNFFFYTISHPDFKFPQVWRSNLGFDTEVGKGWVVTTDLIYTKDMNGMMVRNYGLSLPDATLTGVDNRPVYSAAAHVGNNAYVFTNTDIGYQFNASLQVQKQFDFGLFASIGYNYLQAEDASSIEAEISSDAYDRNPADPRQHVNNAVLSPSLYGNRHRVVGSAYKKFDYADNKLATTLAVFFEYAESGRYSYTYSGDINFDGSGLNDLLYIPTDGEIDQMNFAGTAAEQVSQRAAFQAFIMQDDYLSSRRGEYAEKYAILSPWYSNWDLRILQDVNFKGGEKTHTLQISFDILNVGNLLNSKWGVRQSPVNTQPIGVSTDPTTFEPTYSFDENLTQSLTNDFSLNSRWQAQVGLRYIF